MRFPADDLGEIPVNFSNEPVVHFDIDPFITLQLRGHIMADIPTFLVHRLPSKDPFAPGDDLTRAVGRTTLWEELGNHEDSLGVWFEISLWREITARHLLLGR